MQTLMEGEIRFTFAANWEAEQFDRRGISWPKGVSPVDFVVEGPNECVLVEVKDPSASGAPDQNRHGFAEKMKSRELVYDALVPKARSSYGFLHLMERDDKPMRYVVVIGTEKLSIQPALLIGLNDRLRQRLNKEIDTEWKRKYVSGCAIVSVADFGKALNGCTACRVGTEPPGNPP